MSLWRLKSSLRWWWMGLFAATGIVVLMLYLLVPEGRWRTPTKTDLVGAIAYLADDGQSVNLYVLDLRRGNTVELARGLYEWPVPCWINSGRRLVFGSRRGDAQHLWVTDLDGSPIRDITPNDPYANQMACPNEGSQLVINTPSGLVVLDANSGKRKLLVERTNLWIGFPAWSHDGKTIAFIEGSGESGRPQRLCVIDSTGANRKCIADDAAMFSTPVWSPSDDELAYKTTQQEAQLKPVRVSDGRSTVLQGKPQSGSQGFLWSRDGHAMIYAEGWPDVALSLEDIHSGERKVLAYGIPKYVAASRGGQILFTDIGNPQRSPLFQGIVPCISDCGRAIFVMRADGTDMRRLSTRYKEIHNFALSEW